MSVQTLPINGKEMSTETTFPVVNPATGETIAGAPLPTIGQIDEAVTAARDAFPAWSSLGHEQRQNLLLECAGELAKHSERIGELLTREQGKPLKEGKREVLQAAHYFKVTAGLSLPEEVIEDSDHRLVKVVHKPLGVVAAIAAWNFPLLLAAFKIAPALLAGNTVVLKPSPETPLSTLEVIRILNGILPAGVLNAVTGKEKEGQHLVTHPLVQKVSFTGSVPVGKIIASQAAPSLKRLTLELGGNDAAIVLPDCDPAKIAKAIFWGGFVNNGQTCIAIKRVYVHDDIHDELVEAVAAIAGSMTYGDGTDPASRLGPLATRAQQRHVAALVEDARAKGGTIHCGGEDPGPDSSGFFYPPTVVSGVAEGCRLRKPSARSTIS